MALGDGTIKQNINVQQVQTTPGGAVSSNAVTSNSKSTVVPVAVDEEVLKLLGLTLEQYYNLTDAQKAEVNNQINQIKTASETTNFGITGLYVESTPNVTDDKLPSIEKPIGPIVTTKEQNEIIKTEVVKNRGITEADWKKMSPEKRIAYFETIMDELLKDVPEDQKEAAKLELLDNRIKKSRGFSDDKWAEMSENRKERIRDRFRADFAVVIENGFTKEDLEKLSYLDKLDYSIETNKKALENIQAAINDYGIYHAAGSSEDESLKALKDKKANIENMIKFDTYNKEMFTPIADIAQKTETNKYEGILSNFKKQFEGQAKDKIRRCEAFKNYIINEQLAKVPEEERAGALTDIVVAVANEEPAYVTHLLAELGISNPAIVKALANGEKTPELLEAMAKINEHIEKNGSADLTDDQTAGVSSFYDAVATGSAEGAELAVQNAMIMAAQGRLKAVELYSHSENKSIQSSFHEIGKAAETKQDRVAIYVMNKNLKDNEIRQEQTALGLEGMDAETQLESQKQLTQAAKGDKFVLLGCNDAVRLKYIQKEAQIQFVQNTHDATKYLSDADSIEVQKGSFDAAVVGVDSENQDDIFKIIMSSQFKEVQEYAASNIYKLDESVRDWAADYTRSLGKENLNDAIRMEAPPTDSSKNTPSKAGSDVEYSDSVNNSKSFVTNTISNSTNISNEINKNIENLSSNTKDVYNEINLREENLSKDEAIKYFKSLSRKEQSDLLRALPTQLFNKLPVTICENFPEYVSTFVEKGRGIEIITTCSSIVANSAIKSMKTGSSKTKKELNEFIAQHPEMFNKISQEAAQKALGDSDNNKIEKPLKFKA